MFAAQSHAQPVALTSATNFTSVEYYEAPFERQVKTRVSGAEASQQAGNLNVYIIKQFKLESFETDGKLKMIVLAPECIYDMPDGEANSAGPVHLQMQRVNGKIRTEGEGFLWRQAEGSLIISNQANTVIERPPPAPKPKSRRVAETKTGP